MEISIGAGISSGTFIVEARAGVPEGHSNYSYEFSRIGAHASLLGSFYRMKFLSFDFEAGYRMFPPFAIDERRVVHRRYPLETAIIHDGHSISPSAFILRGGLSIHL